MPETNTYFSKETNLLGESPLWDHRTQVLYWVDAHAKSIKSAPSSGGPVTTWAFDKPIGSIGLGENGLIAAFSDGFYLVHSSTGAATRFADVPIPAPGYRLNDGKSDRFGRFLAGHMTPAGGQAGALMSVNADGTTQQIENGIGLANGLCFSPNGDSMYFTDTLSGILRRYAYDGITGQVTARQDFFDCSPLKSVADGATVDSTGCIWVALVLAHQIARISPEGTLLNLIDSPVKYPSCPAFGGPDMDTLFVTTIADSGGKIKNAAQNAGRVVAFSGLGVIGLPEGILGTLSNQKDTSCTLN